MGIGIAKKTIIQALKPDPDINLREYADKYYHLPSTSIEKGKYRTSRTPYNREILEVMSPQSKYQEAVFVKPTQVGATELVNIMLFGTAYLYPGPAMLAFPNEMMGQKHSKKRIAPAIACNPEVKALFPPKKSRLSGETILFKVFRGGTWTITGAASFSSMRSESIRYMMIDDLDGFEILPGREGDRVSLFRKRTDAYGDRKKIFINSTPTFKGVSPIWWLWENSSMGQFNLPCPKCGKYQFLEFGDKSAKFGIKFTRKSKKQVEKVWYLCRFCGKKTQEAEWKRESNFVKGEYVHKHPEILRRGFRINGLYSPLGLVSWKQVAQDFIESKDDPSKLQVWENTRNANVFEVLGEQPQWKDLSDRAENYDTGCLPAGCLLLTIGVDTHDSGLPFVIWGWGVDQECWLIDYGVCAGDPAAGHCFDYLKQVSETRFKTACGGFLHISQVAIDMRGHRTEAVKNFVRNNQSKFMAVMGATTPGRPAISTPRLADVTWEGVKIKNGVKVWEVGTEGVKDFFYGNLQLPKGKRIHFGNGIEDEIYAQLCSEKRIVETDKRGFSVSRYHRTRANEALDCFVYAYAAAVKVGMLHPGFAWDAIEDALRMGSRPKQPVKKTGFIVGESSYLK